MADESYGESPYMSYGGSEDGASGGGIFGGNIFGGDPCFSQNVLIALIVMVLLYVFVYLPSQKKRNDGFGERDVVETYNAAVERVKSVFN